MKVNKNALVVDDLFEIQHFLSETDTKPWYTQTSFGTSGASYLKLKRFIDIVMCSFALILVFPILLICAIAVRLDSAGPIFYFQERTGKGGRRFKMFKLRTMRKDAEQLKEKYKHLNTLKYPDFKIPNDPRITRVGRFLRKTSLDELPQLLNVLKGDMSLIGPRPTSFHSSTYNLWHTVRLEVIPGVTGLWQVSGRSEVEFDDRIRLDVAYIRNVSLWLDIKIVLLTIIGIFKQEGA